MGFSAFPEAASLYKMWEGGDELENASISSVCTPEDGCAAVFRGSFTVT